MNKFPLRRACSIKGASLLVRPSATDTGISITFHPNHTTKPHIKVVSTVLDSKA